MKFETDDFSRAQLGGGVTSLFGEPTYYEMLNVDRNASRLMIREAYLRLKSLYTNGGDGLYGLGAGLVEQLATLEAAFEVLNDESKRASYDRSLGGTVRASGSSNQADIAAVSSNTHGEANLPQNYSSQQEVIQTSRSTLKVTRTLARGSTEESLQAKFVALMEEGDIADGNFVAKLRDVAGVSEQEIQERTKISLEYIRSIELNRFERLPQVVYVKGFLRSYLRYLNVPNLEKIVSAYAERLAAWQAGQKS